MTNEEIKNGIDGLKFTMNMFLFDPMTGENKRPDCLNDMDKITYDACVVGIKALELVGKADKYRLHDLRKNPEDLPDTPRLVLTKIDFEYWEYEISRYMQFECTGMWMNQKAQPIAWREIEPFEEEEE